MEIVGLIIAFLVILVLVMKRVNLGIAMFIGAVIIGLTSPNIGLKNFFNVLFNGIFNSTTIELVLVIINIGLIAYLMDKTGLVAQLIDGLTILFKRFQPILVLVPSVMGVLAIPGGAMLSAPMVNTISRDLNLSPQKKMATNLLFRHIWNFIFPFTPGLILTAHLMNIDILYLIKHFWPITLALGIAGYIVIFKDLKNPVVEDSTKEIKMKALKDVILALLPLMVGIILPFVSSIPFWGSLFIGVIVLIIYKRDKVNLTLLKKGFEWKLSVSILGIMVFREFVENIDALEQLANGIITKGLPVWVLALTLPGMVGFLTGTISGSVGITYPLLAPLIGGTHPDMSYIVLMYASTFFSYYVSPVHFCLILTAEYFKVSLKDTYKELIIPTLTGIGMATLLYFIY